MSNRKIVVALGGNAILSTDPSAQAQQAALVETARHLVKLIQNGDELIITHGNGPQVGNLLLQHLMADSEKNPAFPLDSLVAMTEGSIGFWLQCALDNALLDVGLDKNVASVVTQVIVDKEDPAFINPTNQSVHSTQKRMPKLRAKKQEQPSKKMPVVAGVKWWLHQNQSTSKKSTASAPCSIMVKLSSQQVEEVSLLSKMKTVTYVGSKPLSTKTLRLND